MSATGPVAFASAPAVYVAVLEHEARTEAAALQVSARSRSATARAAHVSARQSAKPRARSLSPELGARDGERAPKRRTTNTPVPEEDEDRVSKTPSEEEERDATPVTPAEEVRIAATPEVRIAATPVEDDEHGDADESSSASSFGGGRPATPAAKALPAAVAELARSAQSTDVLLMDAGGCTLTWADFGMDKNAAEMPPDTQLELLSITNAVLEAGALLDLVHSSPKLESLYLRDSVLKEHGKVFSTHDILLWRAYMPKITTVDLGICSAAAVRPFVARHKALRYVVFTPDKIDAELFGGDRPEALSIILPSIDEAEHEREALAQALAAGYAVRVEAVSDRAKLPRLNGKPIDRHPVMERARELLMQKSA
jgi:hypothetical protein